MGLIDDLNEEELVVENKYLENVEAGMELITNLLAVPEQDTNLDNKLDYLAKLIEEDYVELAKESDLKTEAEVIKKIENTKEKLEDIVNFPFLSNQQVVAIGGAFSAGKSTFVNSILGDSKLPTDTTPTTSIPTYIAQGTSENIFAHNVFGKKVSIDQEAVNAISHAFNQKYNLSFTQLLKNIILQSKDFPYQNLTFLDTPGYTKSDIHKKADNTDKALARTHLQLADYLIWLVDIERGVVPQQDIEFIKKLDFDKPILFVFNKADKKPPEQVEKIITTSQNNLEQAGIISAVAPEDCKDDFTKDDNFLMIVDDAFVLPGRDTTMVKGKISRGQLSMGEKVIIVDETDNILTTKSFEIKVIKKDKQEIEKAEFGDEVKLKLVGEELENEAAADLLFKLENNEQSSISDHHEAITAYSSVEEKELFGEHLFDFLSQANQQTKEVNILDEFKSALRTYIEYHRDIVIGKKKKIEELNQKLGRHNERSLERADEASVYESDLRDEIIDGLKARIAKQKEIKEEHKNSLDNFKELKEEFVQTVQEILGQLEVDYSDQEASGEELLTALKSFAFQEALELIEQGANINIKDEQGRNPLLLITDLEKEAIKEKWLQQRINLEFITNQELEITIGSYKTTLKSEENLTEFETEELVTRAINKNIDLLANKLIDAGIKLDVQDADGKTALIKFIERGNYNLAATIIKGGAEISTRDENGETALFKAAGKSEQALSLIKLLLEQGAAVNAENKEGETPLVNAVKLSSGPEVLEELIKAGGEIDLQYSDYDTTPLLEAVMFDMNKEQAKVLIEHGADLNLANYEGDTPVIMATRYKNKEILEELINAGADLDRQNNDGETALMVASNIGFADKDILKLLINAGAYLNLTDYLGNTALDNAQDEEIIKILEQAGAKGDSKTLDEEFEEATDAAEELKKAMESFF